MFLVENYPQSITPRHPHLPLSLTQRSIGLGVSLARCWRIFGVEFTQNAPWTSTCMPGWNPCKPHAEDAPRLSKYHAKVFGMTPQKPKTKQNTPSTSTIYAGTRQNLRSHASTPRISKLHAEDIRRDIHRFHPGMHVPYFLGNYPRVICRF